MLEDQIISNNIKTIFLDIDGCVLRHNGSITGHLDKEPELLPGVIDKLIEWEKAGHTIILTTGRRESLRKYTEDVLLRFGVTYDMLIMGLPRGPRVVINDRKPIEHGVLNKSYYPPEMAVARSIVRNEGLINVDV